MRTTRTMRIGGWSAAVIGLALTALPLYAALFTVEELGSEIVRDELSVSVIKRHTTMYVSPWVPFVGGILALGGGFVLGRIRGIESDAKEGKD
jgi:hypothetical protein